MNTSAWNYSTDWDKEPVFSPDPLNYRCSVVGAGIGLPAENEPEGHAFKKNKLKSSQHVFSLVFQVLHFSFYTKWVKINHKVWTIHLSSYNEDSWGVFPKEMQHVCHNGNWSTMINVLRDWSSWKRTLNTRHDPSLSWGLTESIV